MTKFINIDNILIVNIDEIQRIERVLFDLDKQDFEREDIDTKETFMLEFDDFLLAKIYYKNGDVEKVRAGIYSEDDYIKEIDENWAKLISCLDCEYIEL